MWQISDSGPIPSLSIVYLLHIIIGEVYTRTLAVSLFHLTTFKVRISLCREYVIRRQFLQRKILHCSHYSESRIYPRRRRNWWAYPRRRHNLAGKFSGDLAIRGCCTAARTETCNNSTRNVSTCPALLHLTRVASLTSLARPELPALRCQPCAASPALPALRC